MTNPADPGTLPTSAQEEKLNTTIMRIACHQRSRRRDYVEPPVTFVMVKSEKAEEVIRVLTNAGPKQIAPGEQWTFAVNTLNPDDLKALFPAGGSQSGGSVRGE